MQNTKKYLKAKQNYSALYVFRIQVQLYFCTSFHLIDSNKRVRDPANNILCPYNSNMGIFVLFELFMSLCDFLKQIFLR